MEFRSNPQALDLLIAQKNILELMAKNHSLKEILIGITKIAENFSPGCRAAVYFISDGKLILGAAPSFSNAFTEVIDGCPIGENRGVCGHAGHTGQRTISTDVAKDKVWGTFTDWILSFGIKSAFSTPVLSKDGIVIATVSIYYNELYEPTEFDFEIVEVLANLMSIAVERKKQEDLIVEQSIKLLNSSKLSALGEVASKLAYEINPPLTAIENQVTYLRLLAKKTDLSPSDILSSAGEVEKTLCRMMNLMKDLKSTSKEGVKDPFQKVSVKVLIEDTLSFCESRIKKNNVALFLDVKSPDLQIPGRHVQLSQALLNLINNALDAVKKSETKWIRVESEIRGDDAVISVTDSGFGIPLEMKKKIMEPFFTTKGLGNGTGLGLAITRKIVESHEGKLIINENSLNTRFDIFLPVKNLRS